MKRRGVIGMALAVLVALILPGIALAQGGEYACSITFGDGGRIVLDCVPAAMPTATPEPTTTATPAPTEVAPTATPTMAPDMIDMTWHPAGVSHGDRPAHEHGDPVPQWVTDAGYAPMFSHQAGTPGENVPAYKHTAFKQWAGRFGSVDWFGVFHLDTNPIGQAGRFHSYQLWMRDATGAVSHFNGWLDFGVRNNTGSQKVVVCGTDSGVRPIIMVNQAGCPVRFENWYARAGGSGAWAPDVGFNINPTYYDIGNGDPADPAQWTPINGFPNNVTRRIEFAWYRERAQAAGVPFGQTFWATQWGEQVSGPDASICGTQRAIGERSYTVVCLEQMIQPSLPSVVFPGNAVQRTFPSNGVVLPN